MTRDEMVAASKKLAAPIDFRHLEHQGLLSNARNGWWKVNNIGDLPEHVAFQIQEFRASRDGKFVRFIGPKARASAAKLVEILESPSRNR
jgi:hypothetical protein